MVVTIDACLAPRLALAWKWCRECQQNSFSSHTSIHLRVVFLRPFYSGSDLAQELRGEELGIDSVYHEIILHKMKHKKLLLSLLHLLHRFTPW